MGVISSIFTASKFFSKGVGSVLRSRQNCECSLPFCLHSTLERAVALLWSHSVFLFSPDVSSTRIACSARIPVYVSVTSTSEARSVACSLRLTSLLNNQVKRQRYQNNWEWHEWTPDIYWKCIKEGYVIVSFFRENSWLDSYLVLCQLCYCQNCWSRRVIHSHQLNKTSCPAIKFHY